MSDHPKCPKCGEEATYQTPDGTFWDSSAHYWRDASEKAAEAIAKVKKDAKTDPGDLRKPITI